MGKATVTKARSWLVENSRMQSMAGDLVDRLYDAYENGDHDKLRDAIGSDGFRALENYAAQRKVENAALEEFINR